MRYSRARPCLMAGLGASCIGSLIVAIALLWFGASDRPMPASLDRSTSCPCVLTPGTDRPVDGQSANPPGSAPAPERMVGSVSPIDAEVGTSLPRSAAMSGNSLTRTELWLNAPSNIGVSAAPGLTATNLTPWTIPLTALDARTFWHSVRASSSDATWAYLLGTAIQLHAPALVATPVPDQTFAAKLADPP